MKNYLLLTIAVCLMSMIRTGDVAAQDRAIETDPGLSSNVAARSPFLNSQIRFERDRVGHVAFIGGSITEMNGYRPMVMESLQQRYPDTEFTFTDAGISSTCSTTGAFRLQSDVLSKGPVDLFFIEFAVNDDQDAMHARRECIRGLEGIIRQSLESNPRMDIVVTYFVNPAMLDLLQKQRVPVSIDSHEAVAVHYGISTVHLAREVAQQITKGALTWDMYGGTHPGPVGNRLCADMIMGMLTHAWQTPLDQTAIAKPASLPEKPLDPGCYDHGHFVTIEAAHNVNGWQVLVPQWAQLPGGKRDRFTSIPMLCADEPAAEATLTFNGTALGIYVVAGPSAGILEVSIDGGEFEKRDLYHRFSGGLHYPRTVMLATDLNPGEHKATLRISKDHNSASKGHAVRIMQFAVN